MKTKMEVLKKRCAKCGEWQTFEDMLIDDGMPYCWRCTVECSQCNELKIEKRINLVNGGLMICDDCLPNFNQITI